MPFPVPLPLEKASMIDVLTILSFCRRHSELQEVQMVCFDRQTKSYYEEALKNAE